MNEWKLLFEEAVEHLNVDEAANAFNLEKTNHAGTAPAKVKNAAIKLLLKEKSDPFFKMIGDMCRHPNLTCQEVGAIALTAYYEQHSDKVTGLLFQLADSQNWEVREWAASACGEILKQHFGLFLPTMVEWSKEASENHRRAMVLAVMYAGKMRNPDWITPFLDALEPLLSDRSTYVRDNLGPFAIGNSLIRYYPDQVLSRMEQWVQNEDEQVRWNLAMVFSAVEGAKKAGKATRILDILSVDERPMVKKAMQKANKTIKRVNESAD